MRLNNAQASDLDKTIIGQCQVLLDNLDKMSETSKPRHELKKACNRFLHELNAEINKMYHNYKEVGSLDINGQEHDAESLFFNLTESYQELFNRPFYEVITINSIIKKGEDKGYQLSEFEVAYDVKR